MIFMKLVAFQLFCGNQDIYAWLRGNEGCITGWVIGCFFFYSLRGELLITSYPVFSFLFFLVYYFSKFCCLISPPPLLFFSASTVYFISDCGPQF